MIFILGNVELNHSYKNVSDFFIKKMIAHKLYPTLIYNSKPYWFMKGVRSHSNVLLDKTYELGNLCIDKVEVL